MRSTSVPRQRWPRCRPRPRRSGCPARRADDGLDQWPGIEQRVLTLLSQHPSIDLSDETDDRHDVAAETGTERRPTTSAACDSGDPSTPTTIRSGLCGPHPGRAISSEHRASCSASTSWPPNVNAERRRCGRTPIASSVAPRREYSSQRSLTRSPDVSRAASASTSSAAWASSAAMSGDQSVVGRGRREPRLRRQIPFRDGQQLELTVRGAHHAALRGRDQALRRPVDAHQDMAEDRIASGSVASDRCGCFARMRHLRRSVTTSFVGLSHPAGPLRRANLAEK